MALFGALCGRLEAVRRVRSALAPELPQASLSAKARAIAAFLATERSFDLFAAFLARDDELARLTVRTVRCAYDAGISGHRGAASGTSADDVQSTSSLTSSDSQPNWIEKHVLSFNALRRAQTTFEDFYTFYFPLYGLVCADFFRWLPVLVFVEGCIYQMDEENEELARIGMRERDVSSSAEAAIRGVLEAEGLLNKEIEHYLDMGIAYWEMERTLCASMAEGQRVCLDEVSRKPVRLGWPSRWPTGLLADLPACDLLVCLMAGLLSCCLLAY